MEPTYKPELAQSKDLIYAASPKESKKIRKLKTISLIGLCIALLMISFDDTVVNIALPKIQAGLNLDVWQLQWVLTANALPAASLVMSTGRLGDIYGHKKIFLCGLIAFFIGSLICGLAPNLEILIVGRALQGMGDAALLQASLTIIADTFPKDDEKAKAISIWTAASGVALVSGPVIGGFLVDNFGWGSIFFINLPLSILVFWLISTVVKEVKNDNKQAVDLPGFIFSIIFLASLVYALTESVKISHLNVLLFLGISGFSLLVFLLIESRSRNPMLPLSLFRNITFTTVNFVSVLVFFTLVGLLFVFSLFLQEVQGYSPASAGLRFLPFNGAFITASLVSGWLVARMDSRKTITVGLILGCIATLIFFGIDAQSEYRTIMGGFIVFGFACGLTIPPMSTVAMSSVSKSQAGIASAIHGTCNRIGWILGITLQGNILTQYLSADFRQTLVSWGIPSNHANHDKLIADALHNSRLVPEELPVSISQSTYIEGVNRAFVSGFHAVVLVACLALIFGTVLVVKFVASTPKELPNEIS
ncbi:MAG: MFS transporter [Rivularia sp. (in: Bacteria)]|nr:MFS transporter [Rivularia sp. MS3]